MATGAVYAFNKKSPAPRIRPHLKKNLPGKKPIDMCLFIVYRRYTINKQSEMLAIHNHIFNRFDGATHDKDK